MRTRWALQLREQDHVSSNIRLRRSGGKLRSSPAASSPTRRNFRRRARSRRSAPAGVSRATIARKATATRRPTEAIIIVKRRGDGGYDFVNEKDEVKPITFHPIAGGNFVGQAPENGKTPVRLCGLQDRGNEAFIYVPECDKQDKAKLATLGVAIAAIRMLDRSCGRSRRVLRSADARRADLETRPRIVQSITTFSAALRRGCAGLYRQATANDVAAGHKTK